jgi:hypothetical protein
MQLGAQKRMTELTKLANFTLSKINDERISDDTLTFYKMGTTLSNDVKYEMEFFAKDSNGDLVKCKAIINVYPDITPRQTELILQMIIYILFRNYINQIYVV